MRFYTLIFLLTIVFFYGCNSKKNKQDLSMDTNDTKIQTNIKKQNTKVIASLKLEDNLYIDISSTDIQTNICDNEQFIILNIFAPWAKTSLTQLHVLDQFQAQNNNTCIISIALDSDSNTSLPNIYRISHKVIFGLQNNHFIDKITNIMHIEKNFKLPMHMIYKNNHYKNHYQGVMPLEMLRYMIKG